MALVVVLVSSVMGAGILAMSEAATCRAAPPATSHPGTAGGAAPAAASGDWSWFLAAMREQETGSPEGDYAENVAGCQGAYCWSEPDIWRSMAAQAGVDVSTYPDASGAPAALQDAVVTGDLYPIYLAAGGGDAGYTAAAATWNGGTTAVRANPALGPGATNYTYASEVVDKMTELAASAGRSVAQGSVAANPCP